jgi:hypothetical protein
MNIDTSIVETKKESVGSSQVAEAQKLLTIELADLIDATIQLEDRLKAVTLPELPCEALEEHNSVALVPLTISINEHRKTVKYVYNYLISLLQRIEL